jgi:ParB family chromosome partitioning protein
MTARQTLGRGFDALIPKDLDPSLLAEEGERVQKLLIQDIVPNRDQPRREFDSKELGELAESIKQHGILQPIIVVRHGNQYKIVAGERRWRAAGLAKQKSVPAIVRSLEELDQLELALIENIQRVDLSPLEQALAVLKLQQQFNMSLDQISKKLGKASSTVSNLTRLLQLPEPARQDLREGNISEGHARAILALKGDESKQLELLRCIKDNKWTVRQAEEYVLRSKQSNRRLSQVEEKLVLDDLSKKISRKVAIKHTAKGGQLIIPFKDKLDLDRVIQSLAE